MKPFTLLFSTTSNLGNYIKNRKITLINHIPQKGDISVRKTILIVIGITALITLIISIPNITAQAKWYAFERHKNVDTVTKTVTLHDLADMLHDQRTLAGELQNSSTYSLIGDQVRKGLDEASRHEVFLQQHDEIDSIKIRLPITSYKDKNKTIEFISGEGEVVETYRKE
jgi:hypothetical protein